MIAKYIFALFFLLILFYWLLPPISQDSADYHYHAVFWNESEKIIPGLGNVHSRLGFNPINFIIAAPYSFSQVTQQSIYPLNAVLVAIFYVWLLQQAISNRSKWSSIMYILAAVSLLRPLLGNIPSPSSEPLAIICVSFVFLKLIELSRNDAYSKWENFTPIIIIAVFSICAKLSSLPVLLIPGIWMLFFLPKMRFVFYLKLTVLLLFLLVPWITRNVVLSGYVLYPLYNLDVFNFDWQVPRDIAIVDYALGTYGYKGDLNNISGLSGFNWIASFLNEFFRPERIIELLIFIPAFTSPVAWIVFFAKKRKFTPLFILWCCAFTASIIWFIRAPDIRFGIGFLIASFTIPLVAIFDHTPIRPQQFRLVSLIIVIPVCCYYMTRPFFNHPRLHANGIEKLWLMPLKDKRYHNKVNMNTFPYKDLGNGVKLYLPDSAHDAINIKDQPSMIWHEQIIEMRGTTINEGFRSVRSKARDKMPNIFKKEW